MTHNKNSPLNGRVTAAAMAHALRLIEMYYPDMPDDRKQVQAARLAMKINKKEKH